jgi:hypothetical protein
MAAFEKMQAVMKLADQEYFKKRIAEAKAENLKNMVEELILEVGKMESAARL